MGGTADIVASAAGDIFGGGAGFFGGDAFTLAASDVAAQAAAGAISAADAISSGASVSDLISAGVAPSQLVSEGVASVPDLLSAGVSTSQLSADGLISTVGDGNIMDLATGNILDSSGQTILNAANEGLTSGSQITGATTDASGNITQTFDDGSTLTTDAQGNVINSTEATDTGVPPTDGTNPLTNPVVQKVGSTIAQKALSSLLAPATKALATGTPVSGTTAGGLTSSAPTTDTTATPTTQFLTPSFGGGNANYTLSDNTVTTPTAQPYTAPTDVALMAPQSAPQLATGGQVDVDGETQDHVPQFYSEGGLQHRYVKGAGDGTSDDVPAMLANGEFVIPADVVSSLGNGSNDSGSKVLDNFLETIREHKQKHDAKHLPPDSKGPLAYLLEAHKKVKS
jgi:hypothetical protein